MLNFFARLLPKKRMVSNLNGSFILMEREYQPKFHKLQPINQLKIFLMSTMYEVHLSTKSGSFNFHSNRSTKELSKGTMNRTIDLKNARTGYKTINKKFGEKVTTVDAIIEE